MYYVRKPETELRVLPAVLSPGVLSLTFVGVMDDHNGLAWMESVSRGEPSWTDVLQEQRGALVFDLRAAQSLMSADFIASTPSAHARCASLSAPGAIVTHARDVPAWRAMCRLHAQAGVLRCATADPALAERWAESRRTMWDRVVRAGQLPAGTRPKPSAAR